MLKLSKMFPFLSGAVLMLIIGWFVFPALLYQRTDQPIQFNHKTHTGEKGGMMCGDCHTFNDDGRFAGLPAIDKCAMCHSAQLGNSPDEKKLVEEYVTKNRDIPWLVYSRQPENAYFSHAQHVRLAEIKCERCHGPHGGSDGLPAYEQNRISGYSRAIWGSAISGIKTKPWDGMKMDDCSNCHRERGVQESCLGCHK